MALSDAEKQSRYRARVAAKLAARLAEAEARAGNVTEHLAALVRRAELAEARVAELEAGNVTGAGNVTAMRRRAERAEARVADLEAKLASNVTGELRELTRLKAANEKLQAANRVLTARLAAAQQAKAKRTQGMPMALFRDLVRALHPDSRAGLTAKQLDEACGKLTAWRGGK